ncbi:MAG: GTP-binding protein [Candidatus Helarchaeota archaeon]|nr:GTP-binding protein [Candidatus Helarchaeota archaeon]
MVVDNDGLVFASTLKSDLEDLVMSALTAHMQTLSERIKQEADSGYFKNLTLEMEKQKFIFNEAGPEYLLLTVVDKDAGTDTIIKYARIVADKIAKILKGEPTSLELEKIHEVSAAVEKEEPKPIKKCVFKVVIVGEPRVGKTSLVVKFAKGRFESVYRPTLGVDVIKHSYQYNSNINLIFTAWDISGQASFKKLRRSYYPNTEGFFVIYDTTHLESFERVNDWVEEIKQYGTRNSIFILVGNKIDLESERVVSKEKGERKAKELGVFFYETSAKSGRNVNDLFYYLGEKIIERRKLASSD